MTSRSIALDPKIAKTLDEDRDINPLDVLFSPDSDFREMGCMVTTSMANSLPVGLLKANEKTVPRTGTRSTAFGFEQRTSNAKPLQWINFLPTKIQC